MNPADMDPERTALAPSGIDGGGDRTCPLCGAVNGVGVLRNSAYLCPSCKRPLAHVDYLANGSIRGIFGWLLAQGDTVLNRYKVKSVLGQGGFGAAYLVDDLQLSGKRRALKEVPEPLFDEHETALLSRLDHPAIPDIIERGAANGMVYLVLKFGGDRTLDHERKRHPDQRIPLAKLLPLMRQLCDVLIYLHSQTPPIIHRDLKPGNVLLDENERIMLVDFGIAKEAAPETMTRTLGRATTHGYSPPEQVTGTGTDERSDIYALGATCYALLTGQVPPGAYERVSGKDLLPPSQLVPNLPPELDEAILRALSLNMNHRPQTMREFADALAGIEWEDSTPPAYTELDEPRTMAMGKSSSLNLPPSLRSGLRIPTGRHTATRHGSTAPSIPSDGDSGLRFRRPVAWAAGVALFLAAAVGLYFQFSPSKPEPAEAIPPAASTTSVPPQTATPLPSPSSIAPPAPVQPQPAPPPGAAGSVEDMVRNNRPATSEAPPSSGKSAIKPTTSNHGGNVSKQEHHTQASARPTPRPQPPPMPRPASRNHNPSPAGSSGCSAHDYSMGKC